jgi:exonuclease SbcD
MKIFHASDLHYAPKTQEEVDRCFAFAVARAINEKCDVAVLSGDLFDHRVDLNAPCVAKLLQRVYDLADHMPVLILQGTYSHDTPGALDVFKTMGGAHEVFVADRICQVALIGNEWTASNSWIMEPSWSADWHVPEAITLFSCLPSVNKAAVAAVVGGENAAEAVGEHVFNLMRGWSEINLKAREAGIQTILVSHGTVSGSITEQGVPMAGLDHEFTTASLFAAETSAVMLGHIHQFQAWVTPDGKRLIAYPGSIGRLHFGETQPKGFLIWDVGETVALAKFSETPAKRLLQIDFPGLPDMMELERQAADCAGAHVRIRYCVDEEHRGSIDKPAIVKMFEEANELSIEGRVNPIQRSRSEGMNRATSLTEKLEKWCDVTQSDKPPLVSRLADLEAYDTDEIVGAKLRGDHVE